MERFFKHYLYVSFCFLLMLSACKKEEEEKPGQAPSVSAGADMNGTVGEAVSLNGTATDPDGDQLAISWEMTTKPDGSSASLDNSSNLNTSFTPDVAGSYTLKLTADDGVFDPVSDEVNVTVEEAVGEPPVAAILDENGEEISADNENNTVAVGSNYVLDASSSSDPDGGQLSYAWEVTEAPQDAEYTLTENESKTQATFAPATVGEYTIKVTVTDPDENAVSAEVVLNATAESIEVTENVDADTTWIDLFADPNTPDYIVKNDITVNAALTLQPGVVIHVDEDAIITVESNGGELIAQGTQEKPIVFTSSNEAGEIYWGGLLINSSSANNVMDFVTIKFGGGNEFLVYIDQYYRANIAIEENGKISISNSTITYSEGDGLIVKGTGNLSQFENNTFANNTNFAMSVSFNQAGAIAASNTFQDNGDTQKNENLVRIYDSTMDQDQELFALGGDGSFVFVGDANVEAKLTIHEGVEMKFEEEVIFKIGESGSVIAKGTADNRIIFTSNNIGDGRNWGGILVASSSANNELDHVEIHHAGGNEYLIYDGGYMQANLAIDQGAKLILTNTDIAHSDVHGLIVHSDGFLNGFANNNFHDNTNYALMMPANQAGMLDTATTIANNGDDVVAIMGSTFDNNAKFSDESNPRWVALHGEARYLVLEELNIEDDMVVAPGAFFMVMEDVVINVNETGSLKAIGTADSIITFTAYQQDGNSNWGGLGIHSDNGNDIQYASISYAGADQYLIYSGGYYQGNIGVDANASLQLLNTEVTNSKSYGLVVASGSTVNGLDNTGTDPATAIINENTFADNAAADVFFVE